MKIRPARRSDYRQLIILLTDFVGDSRYEKPGNDSFSSVLKDRRNFIFVAEENGNLAGFGLFGVRRVVRYPKPIMEVDEMYVAPKHRKHGIGRKLMAEVEKKAKALECHRIFLESHRKRKAAHKFYASLGYTNDGYYFIKNF